MLNMAATTIAATIKTSKCAASAPRSDKRRRRVTDVEEGAAARAHVDPQALERARDDLGVITSRANAGGVMAVQWALPA